MYAALLGNLLVAVTKCVAGAYTGSSAYLIAVDMDKGTLLWSQKIAERSGLWEAVGGNVLIYIHKERELDDVEQRYPAEHYVLVDDNLCILTAVKEAWRDRVTTVFPRQGRHAPDPKVLASYPPADVSVDRIGDLLAYELPELLAALPPLTTQNRKRQ